MQRGLGYGHKDARHSKFNPSTYLRIESAQMHKPRTVVSLSVFKGMRVRVVPYKPAQHTHRRPPDASPKAPSSRVGNQLALG